MIWRILNFIFGWDYIVWTNFADSGIARIHYGYNGRPWYWRYKLTKVIDKVTSVEQVVWLTCLPSDYLRESK